MLSEVLQRLCRRRISLRTSTATVEAQDYNMHARLAHLFCELNLNLDAPPFTGDALGLLFFMVFG